MNKKVKSIHSVEYINLIQELCHERRRLGLSQNEVAIQLGMTQSEVSRIETCERRIDIYELQKMLQLYRIKENFKLQDLITAFFRG